jgi:hypothetical protein
MPQREDFLLPPSGRSMLQNRQLQIWLVSRRLYDSDDVFSVDGSLLEPLDAPWQLDPSSEYAFSKLDIVML